MKITELILGEARIPINVNVAEHPEIKGTYNIIAKLSNGLMVGDLWLGRNRHDDSKWSSMSTWVAPDYRRQGIGTDLYNTAHRAGFSPIVPDDKLSPDAEAFWHNHTNSKLRLGKPLPKREWRPA